MRLTINNGQKFDDLLSENENTDNSLEKPYLRIQTWRKEQKSFIRKTSKTYVKHALIADFGQKFDNLLSKNENMNNSLEKSYLRIQTWIEEWKSFI